MTDTEDIKEIKKEIGLLEGYLTGVREIFTVVSDITKQK